MCRIFTNGLTNLNEVEFSIVTRIGSHIFDVPWLRRFWQVGIKN